MHANDANGPVRVSRVHSRPTQRRHMMYRIPVSTSGARAMLAAAAIVGTAACASHPPVTTESPTRTAQSSRYVLVATDIERAKSDNVYDAIAKLRPEFLRGHSDVTSFVNQQIPTSSKDPGAAATPPGTATAAVQSVPPVIAY